MELGRGHDRSSNQGKVLCRVVPQAVLADGIVGMYSPHHNHSERVDHYLGFMAGGYRLGGLRGR